MGVGSGACDRFPVVKAVTRQPTAAADDVLDPLTSHLCIETLNVMGHEDCQPAGSNGATIDAGEVSIDVQWVDDPVGYKGTCLTSVIRSKVRALGALADAKHKKA